MAVAPLGSDPDAAFARLADVSTRLIAAHPAAASISAGMSGDLAAAIRHGSTHVRVGSALLGPRSPVFG
jgi:PLP dependent protein